ncbi:MAG: NAD-dependent malic enzyme [Labilithrix sp.]|nr:NAD-dependent malic enzyme [Labilithrix sp.]
MTRLSRSFELIRERGEAYLRVHTDGVHLLRLALTNKGTAFPLDERIALGLDGLLPPHVGTLDEQLTRVYAAYAAEPTALAKYSYLRALQERNEILFYALLERHLEEMLPIVYTPTVGEAVQKFNALYQSARGLSLSCENIDRAHAASRNCLLDDVRMIVATDSSAILGIGDQGYGGMAIAIGKLALYTVAGGVSPYRSLPVGLDVGTDRKDLTENASYLGVRRSRLTGDDYIAFMDRVVDAIHERWPRAILQWEDLSKDTAFTVLERYRKRLPSFNDDIQGTGAVALAGLVVACASQNRKLSNERVLVYGAGAGGAGVAFAIREGMKREGLTDEQARERVLVLDSKGLLVEGRPMEAYKAALAQRRENFADWAPASRSDGSWDLLDTIQNGNVTALLGLSGQPGTFTEPVVRAVAKNVDRPIVFALSNPTTSCEAQPADILAWTDGRALVATGSPFAPVRVGNRDVAIGQGNNAFVFPGLGFGAILADASEITDGMVLAASYALADYTRKHHSELGLLYPPVDELRAVSLDVATRVIQQAFADGVARTKKVTPEDAGAYVRSKAWSAEYLPFRRA